MLYYIHLPSIMITSIQYIFERVIICSASRSHHTFAAACTWSSCETIQEFRIEISDRDYAETSGKLRMEVRQGSTTCATVRETFYSPRKNSVNFQTDRTKFGSCDDVRFDTGEDVELRVLSDSGDDSYMDNAALKLGGVWREWSGYQVKVNKHGEGSEWRSTVRSNKLIKLFEILFRFGNTN